MRLKGFILVRWPPVQLSNPQTRCLDPLLRFLSSNWAHQLRGSSFNSLVLWTNASFQSLCQRKCVEEVAPGYDSQCVLEPIPSLRKAHSFMRESLSVSRGLPQFMPQPAFQWRPWNPFCLLGSIGPETRHFDTHVITHPFIYMGIDVPQPG